MANLQKENDPRRLLMWNGKSIILCSKKELIACVIHLAGQLAEAGKKITAAGSAPEIKPYNAEENGVTGE